MRSTPDRLAGLVEKGLIEAGDPVLEVGEVGGAYLRQVLQRARTRSRGRDLLERVDRPSELSLPRPPTPPIQIK